MMGAITNFFALKSFHEAAKIDGPGRRRWIEFADIMMTSFPHLYKTAALMNSRMANLESAMRCLVSTIDLHTDLTDGLLDVTVLDTAIGRAEYLLGPTNAENENTPPFGAGVLGYFTGTWIDATRETPDSDTTFFVSIEGGSEPVWLGYHDSEVWRSVDGDEINVVAYSDIPEPARRHSKEGEHYES